MRNLSLGRRHQVNERLQGLLLLACVSFTIIGKGKEVKAGIGVIAGNTV